MTNDNPSSIAKNEASKVVRQNRPILGTVISTSIDRNSNNPRHSVRVSLPNEDQPIEAEVPTTSAGDHYIPTNSSRVYVWEVANGIWLALGAESNVTGEEFDSGDRVIGLPNGGSRLYLHSNGDIDIEHTDGPTVSIQSNVSGDEDDTIIIDDEDNDVVEVYENEYK